MDGQRMRRARYRRQHRSRFCAADTGRASERKNIRFHIFVVCDRKQYEFNNRRRAPSPYRYAASASRTACVLRRRSASPVLFCTGGLYLFFRVAAKSFDRVQRSERTQNACAERKLENGVRQSVGGSDGERVLRFETEHSVFYPKRYAACRRAQIIYGRTL